MLTTARPLPLRLGKWNACGFPADVPALTVPDACPPSSHACRCPSAASSSQEGAACSMSTTRVVRRWELFAKTKEGPSDVFSTSIQSGRRRAVILAHAAVPPGRMQPEYSHRVLNASYKNHMFHPTLSTRSRESRSHDTQLGHESVMRVFQRR